MGSIEGIADTIGQLDDVSSTVAAAVEKQEFATQEIAGGVEQVAIGAQDVSTNISLVSAAALSTGDTASDMLMATGELSEMSTILETAVNEFLETVRAA